VKTERRRRGAVLSHQEKRCYDSAYSLALRAAVDKVSGVQRVQTAALVGVSRLIALRFLASRKPGARVPCVPVRRMRLTPRVARAALGRSSTLRVIVLLR
jgi:hypothetical protein